jgi:hypothetical protein
MGRGLIAFWNCGSNLLLFWPEAFGVMGTPECIFFSCRLSRSLRAVWS